MPVAPKKFNNFVPYYIHEFMESPLFSIITITYNAQEVLRPTLASVSGQSFRNFEHIIIDGASRDDTVSIARNEGIDGIKIFSEPDRGLYDAMNKGIARATGSYLIFLNAGDSFAATNALSRLAEAAKDNPDIIYGQTQLVDAERIVWVCVISQHPVCSLQIASSMVCSCATRLSWLAVKWCLNTTYPTAFLPTTTGAFAA